MIINITSKIIIKILVNFKVCYIQNNCLDLLKYYENSDNQVSSDKIPHEIRKKINI